MKNHQKKTPLKPTTKKKANLLQDDKKKTGIPGQLGDQPEIPGDMGRFHSHRGRMIYFMENGS